MKYGLLGEKLGHSFSALIHARLGLYQYQLYPVAKEDFSLFMERRDFSGINVTIPYKKDVIAYLKEISPEASVCGAVNTIVNRNGELFGFNTDILGLQALLNKTGVSLSGKNVLILGSGGTSGTALALCQKLGARSAERLSRTGKEGSLTYREAATRGDTQVIINTTPCGMYPQIDACPISLSSFPHLEAVADAVYNPLKSQLVVEGEKRGVPSVGGLFMLVAQAVYAAGIFTERKDLEDRICPIYEELLKEKQNIVLIGMPGSGKSTIGRALAKRLGKEFVDSDEQIVKMAEESIPEIFAKEGEASFRDRESRAIRELSARQGVVIATGGGAVLREKNLDLLRQNGILVFLDAPLESLRATADRPLSSDFESLKQRYEERYEIYCRAADYRIPVSRNVEENVCAIIKELS